MKYDIISFGSAVMDVFLETDAHEHGKEICYSIGAKIKVNKINFNTGGGGTNTAVSFSRLGLKTGFLGKLGNDENAEIILKELKKEKVDFLGVLGKENTGYSVILDSREHDRTILTYKGVNDKLRIEEVKRNVLDTGWFYFSSASGETLKTQEEIIKKAKGKIKIAYNASLYQIKEDSSKLKKILKGAENLVLNKEEAEELVGRNSTISKLRELGPRIVCVTNGDEGSEIFDGYKTYKVEAHKTKCVEATGAGDAFASGFVFGLMKFRNIQKAAQIGTLNAESVIQYKGAKVGLLNFRGVSEMMRKRKVKISVFLLDNQID